MSSTASGPESTFRCFRQFNKPEMARFARGKWRLTQSHCELFPGDDFNSKLARQICISKSMRLKEVLESFEFFYRVKRRIQAPHIIDLCAGHGLTGLLFAALERRVTTVQLVDTAPPPLFEKLFDAVCQIAPWTKDKTTYVIDKMDRVQTRIPKPCAIISVHACGVRTDRALDLAISQKADMAVMPCCYNKGADHGLPAIKTSLGLIDSADIHRTYRLTDAEYEVHWSAISSKITDMNRILIALQPSNIAVRS